jgi:hypothetical protein
MQVWSVTATPACFFSDVCLPCIRVLGQNEGELASLLVVNIPDLELE